MPKVPKMLDTDRLAAEHLSGTSLRTLARREGVNSHRLADELRAAGHYVRSRSDASALANEQREHGDSVALGNNVYHSNLRKKKMEIVRQHRNERGCCRCGEDHPATLSLHHVDPESKHPRLKRFVNGKKNHMGWTALSYLDLKAELDKCEVFCENCHRILHWEEKFEKE